MATFRGKLLSGGRTALGTVLGDVEVREGGEWDGSFMLPQGVFVPLGNDYTLVFEDGRSGDILLENLAGGSHSCTLVHFKGVGPLRAEGRET